MEATLMRIRTIVEGDRKEKKRSIPVREGAERERGMSEPFRVKLPMRMGYHDFNLMRQAFSLRGIDIEEALEIERSTVTSRGIELPFFIIHGPKKVQGERNAEA